MVAHELNTYQFEKNVNVRVYDKQSKKVKLMDVIEYRLQRYIDVTIICILQGFK